MSLKPCCFVSFGTFNNTKPWLNDSDIQKSFVFPSKDMHAKINEQYAHFHKFEEGSSFSFRGNKSSMSENENIYQNFTLDKYVKKVIIWEK